MAFSQYANEATENQSRVARVLLGSCADQLRDLLRYHIPPPIFPQVIHQQRMKLRLTKPQVDLILPRSGHYSGNYSDFDISLLYLLLRNICNIQPPMKGWGLDPDPTDRSLAANIERIRMARNLCASLKSSYMSNLDFNEVLSNIRPAVVEMDIFLNNNRKYERAVDYLRNATLDPTMAKAYESVLREKMEEDMKARQLIEGKAEKETTKKFDKRLNVELWEGIQIR